MSDRINYLTVGLKEDIKDEDCKAVIQAIGMIRGVLDVQPHIADADSWISYTRARQELGEKLFSIIYPKS